MPKVQAAHAEKGDPDTGETAPNPKKKMRNVCLLPAKLQCDRTAHRYLKTSLFCLPGRRNLPPSGSKLCIFTQLRRYLFGRSLFFCISLTTTSITSSMRVITKSGFRDCDCPDQISFSDSAS